MTNQSKHHPPHIYGATPQHYRQGTAIATLENPPCWDPTMMESHNYPYTLEEYRQDIERWMGATKVAPSRHGPLVALALGDTARHVMDQIPTQVLINGIHTDLNDGRGLIYLSGVDVIFFHLNKFFPTDREALMLRTGIEFFNFQPLAGETLHSLFLRYDTLLDRANKISDLGISYPFRTWMLLCLLRLPPKKWLEYLKDFGHILPRNEQMYQHVQTTMLKEEILLKTVSHMDGARPRSNYLMISDDNANQGGEREYLPLYLALSQQHQSELNGSNSQSEIVGSGVPQREGGNTYHAITVSGETSADSDKGISIYEIEEITTQSDSDSCEEYTDDEQWEAENDEDPWDEDRLKEEVKRANEDPHYLHELFWAMRKSIRRYRAARGRFRPRARRGRRNTARRYTTRGPNRPPPPFLVSEAEIDANINDS